jgi:hypothetical protein
MLFDQLDIERHFEPSYFEEHRLYCSARQRCQDGSQPGFFGGCDDGKDAVWVPDDWPEGKPPSSNHTSTAAGRARAMEEEGRDIGGTSTEEPEDEAKTAEAKERVARWQDQCFLIEGWQAVTDKFQTCKADLDNSGYENIIPILEKSSDVVSLLANRENANIFFSLSPAQLSMLVPSIRLFIVRYKEITTKEGRKIVVEDNEPQELYLDDYTEKSLVQEIMVGKSGRASAVGLDSFSYEFDGKDPATTNSLIKANLNLIFTSFDRLLQKQDNGAKFLDLMLRTKRMIKQSRSAKIAKDKDNIYNKCKEDEDSNKNDTDDAMVFNTDYRRIKASIGWALPPGDLFYQLFPKDIQGRVDANFKKNIINLFEELKLNLFLEMTTYDINFRNDGKVELSIDYRAAIEGELNRPEANIFYQLEKETKKINDSKDARVTAAAKKRKKVQDEENKKTKKAEGKPSDESKERTKAAVKEAGVDIRLAENKAAAQIQNQRLFWYGYFQDALESTQRLIEVTVSDEALKLWKGDRDFAAPGAKKEGEPETDKETGGYTGAVTAGEVLKTIFDGNGNQTKMGKYRIVNDGLSTKIVTNAPTSPAGRAAAPKPKEGKVEVKEGKKLDKDEQKKRDAAASSPAGQKAGQRKIYFTFLGDILDVAMKFLNDINLSQTSRKPVRLITSQITFSDPSSLVKGKQRKETLNIADIPVSFDEFVLWFYNKVIKPGRTNYPVMEFIKDVMTNLVFQAFGYNCVGGAPSVVPILNHTLFDAPRLEGRKEPLTPGKRYNNLKALRAAKDKMNFTLTKGPEDVVNYVIIHGSARSFVNKNAGNIEQDERDGIYHFGLGLNRGILKEIKFKGNTLAYATETRVIEDNQSGLEQLFEKFDATVDLYGCPIFRNGQYLYLDPATMGVSSDIARAIGLGGYYVIYGVSGQLNRSDYTMDLQCKYQGSGLCGDESVDKSRNICADQAAAAQGGFRAAPAGAQETDAEKLAREMRESGVEDPLAP